MADYRRRRGERAIRDAEEQQRLQAQAIAMPAGVGSVVVGTPRQARLHLERLRDRGGIGVIAAAAILLIDATRRCTRARRRRRGTYLDDPEAML